MRSTDYKVERVGYGLLLCVALLMFFQPLVKLHGPNGSQISNALNVRYELSQYQSRVRTMATVKYWTDSGASLVPVAGAPRAATVLAIPFSLRTAWVVPWFIFAALVFCLLALADHLFTQKRVALLSLLGGCAGAVAVLHVMLMGSDLRSWTEILMNSALINAPPNEDPSGLIMMASSFAVSPGFGLSVLSSSLLVVPLLSFTRAVPRARSVMRRDRRVSLSQPVRFRPVNSRYPEETCTCVDVSEGGLLVQSALDHHYVGMEVYVTRNARDGASGNPEEHGSVVRVEKRQKGAWRVAIRVIPEA